MPEPFDLEAAERLCNLPEDSFVDHPGMAGVSADCAAREYYLPLALAEIRRLREENESLKEQVHAFMVEANSLATKNRELRATHAEQVEAAFREGWDMATPVTQDNVIDFWWLKSQARRWLEEGKV